MALRPREDADEELGVRRRVAFAEEGEVGAAVLESALFEEFSTGCDSLIGPAARKVVVDEVVVALETSVSLLLSSGLTLSSSAVEAASSSAEDDAEAFLVDVVRRKDMKEEGERDGDAVFQEAPSGISGGGGGFFAL